VSEEGRVEDGCTETTYGDASHDERLRKARLRGLVEKHFAGVWRFLRHLGVPERAVDDAAQDVFLIASNRIDEIHVGSEQSFLFNTAFRLAQTQRRMGARESLEGEIDLGVDQSPTPEDKLDKKQARALAYRLLDELEDDLRHVFVLYEIEGMTMQRIATTIDVPIGTVASRLRRAREHFQVRLEQNRKRLLGQRSGRP
jgi:RNA polymerase sigma-70 factor (ECF subfamily)